MPAAPDTHTITATDITSAPGRLEHAPHLFLVMEAHQPLAPPARIALEGMNKVTFGRGPSRAVTRRDGEEDGSAADVRVDDPRMSSRHARLTRLLKRWVLEDLGSKNGTLVNGVKQGKAAVSDGDLIELGHTFFVFREALAPDPDAPAIADASVLAAPAPGLATVVPALAREYARFASLASAGVSMLLEGETGTGKEVLARALHQLSGRTGPFVAVNCGALPRELIEGELFGHRKGSFSGASEDRLGLVRSADKGTLFLDEIGDLPSPAQAVLLRVLQEREVRPVGGSQAVPIDLRVVSATHRALDEMVAAGAFRADLLARIAGHRFALPPLRGRREDVGLLTGAILRRLCRGSEGPPAIHPRAARALLRHGWPLNVRELEQCLTSAVVLARASGQGMIDVEHLPAAVRRVLSSGAASREEEEAARREEILRLLREHAGNISKVAESMGKARTQIQRWLKHYRIEAEQFRR